MTVIACRNMWLMAQETMKRKLHDLGAHLIDNVVLTDRAHSAATFISTPLWMLTGRRGPFLFGVVPAAGIAAEDIAAASRFGRAIEAGLPGLDPSRPHPLLTGTGAVRIDERLIASETDRLSELPHLGPPAHALGTGSLRATPCRALCLHRFSRDDDPHGGPDRTPRSSASSRRGRASGSPASARISPHRPARPTPGKPLSHG